MEIQNIKATNAMGIFDKEPWQQPISSELIPQERRVLNKTHNKGFVTKLFQRKSSEKNQFEDDQNIRRLQISLEVLDQLNQGNRVALTELIRNELAKVGLSEQELVFRGLAHPPKNITGQLLSKYGTDRFLTGQLAPFLIMYKSSHVHTECTPGNKGGELWRTTFLTEPKEALAAVIRFTPPA